MEEKIVLYIEKAQCCGCSACYSVCPANAITMAPDEEGFLYPEIDFCKCIGCKNALKLVFLKRIKQKKVFNLSIILHGRKIENV